MLKRKFTVYDDGRKEDKIFYTDCSKPTTFYPIRDGIKHAVLATFKYKVKLKENETVALINFPNKKVLMPSNIVVHPKTTLKDVEVIRPRKKRKNVKTYKFKSSSSDSTYIVREKEGKLTCNCAGFFRVKDKDKGCKHIQNVKSKTSKS